jgi:osmoprotectant transport system substrate-binding protein
VLAAASAAVVSGCGGNGASGPSTTPARHGPGVGRPPLVLGNEGFTEQRILGELYSQALRARGYPVRLRSDLPTREAADRALVEGQIDGSPEYIGTILAVVAGRPQPPTGLAAAYRAVRAVEARRGFAALPPTPFSRTDGLAATASYARAHALASIGDLAAVGRFALGGPPDFPRRTSGGQRSLRRTYGLSEARFVPLSLGAEYGALDRGRVQSAVVTTTDARLRSPRYAVLDDPRHVFGIQNVVPVFSRAVLGAEGPGFARTVNAVSAKLTTAAMRRLNAAVEVQKRTPAEAAHDFLRAQGLL